MKNWVLSQINYQGIFISILSCEMKWFIFFLDFERLILFPYLLRLMILMNRRTAKSNNLETNLKCIQNTWLGLYSSQSLQGSFFRILVLRKLKIFMLEFFFIFTWIYIIYFTCIKNKYWVFVILKFSVLYYYLLFYANSFSIIE